MLLGQRSSGTAKHPSQVGAGATRATREEQADQERIRLSARLR